jgi:hypothetical protein
MFVRTRYAYFLFCLIAGTALASLITASNGTSIARGALSPPNTGIGMIRTGGGNWGTLSNTDKYSVLVVSAGNADAAGTKPGRALTWGCGVNVPNATWSSTCGVSWSDAVANNWLLKDSSGNYVGYGDGYSYLADIGNTSYQQKFVSQIDAAIRSHPGVDGVFIDNVVGHLIRPSVKYPDSASYRAAMLSFMKAVGPALKAKGWYVDVNISMSDGSCSACGGQAYDGSQWIWWAGQLASSVNGINMEHWQQLWDSAATVRVTGSTANTAWDGWQRVPGAVQGMGKDFFAMEKGGLTDSTKMTYLKGCFLLEWNGGSSAFIYTDNYAGTGDPWNPAWTLDIGQPSGAKFQAGAGWRRNYTGGTVVVNPSTSTQIFSLGGTYLTAGGTAVTSVTLGSGTAIILRTPTTVTTTSTSTTTTTPTSSTTTTTPSTTSTTATTTPTTATTTTPTTTTTTPTTATTTTPTTTSTPTTTTTTSSTTTSTTTTTTPTTSSSPPVNAKLPMITGPDQVAKNDKASQGGWNGATSFAYRWSRCDSAGRNCVAITGATTEQYLVTAADEGHTLVVTVIASNSWGTTFATSLPSAVIKSIGK